MSDEMNKKVLQAKTDEKQLETLIKDHKNFILANAYKMTGHYVTENDDEWSVGLIAFHEAVRTFDEGKGDFHAFAALVIKRRMIDYLKSQAKYDGEWSVPPEMMSGEVDDDSPDKAIGLKLRERIADVSETEAEVFAEQSDIKDEIEAVQKILKEYGFSFFDLADCSPKADKTKKMCARAVAVLLTNAEVAEKMKSAKTLPVKDICEKSLVPRKILERHRKYIIAATEILNGEYPLLAEYMSYIRKELVT